MSICRCSLILIVPGLGQHIEYQKVGGIAVRGPAVLHAGHEPGNEIVALRHEIEMYVGSCQEGLGY